MCTNRGTECITIGLNFVYHTFLHASEYSVGDESDGSCSWANQNYWDLEP